MTYCQAVIWLPGGGPDLCDFFLNIPYFSFFFFSSLPNSREQPEEQEKPYPWANEEKKADMQFMARTIIRHFRRPTLSARPPQINAPNIIPRNTIKPEEEKINHRLTHSIYIILYLLYIIVCEREYTLINIHINYLLFNIYLSFSLYIIKHYTFYLSSSLQYP